MQLTETDFQTIYIYDIAGPKLGTHGQDLNSSLKKLIFNKMTKHRAKLCM